MNLSARLVESEFRQRFAAEPLVIRAPGRINLIGEHTDYNNGFVMPAAVDREIWFAVAAAGEQRSTVYSCQYQEVFEIDIANPQPVSSPRWANYLLGIVRQFIDHGYVLQPFHCVFGGDIPQGAGMSSSAALECGFATALDILHGYRIPKNRIVEMAQWAEHHYVGVKCGIMDQFASTMGKRDHAILLDCATMEYRYLPLPLDNYSIVLCDTRVKHSLVDSEYNVRREECEAGVRILRKHHPEVASLRQATEAMLRQYREEMPGRVYDRCTYVVSEIARVVRAADALEHGDLRAFGEMMFATHEGLSSLYEVSCPELDFLVRAAREFEGAIGARMMGGGFGGCTINLVESGKTDAFAEAMRLRYHERFAIDMPVYRVRLVDGVSEKSGV